VADGIPAGFMTIIRKYDVLIVFIDSSLGWLGRQTVAFEFTDQALRGINPNPT
jgi:hypothetical protein